ncbi:MAG: hypothetical protein QG602_4007 [Verrucomicrobiota bacterium]|nr:hypothetical protein [Verrucomicrobiota bacterium]
MRGFFRLFILFSKSAWDEQPLRERIDRERPTATISESGMSLPDHRSQQEPLKPGSDSGNAGLELRSKLARLRTLQPLQNSATLAALSSFVAESSLNRFVDAQAGALGPQFGDYGQALQELQSGQKRAHWMWYVLPQLRGIGTSEMSFLFGIESREEARAYLDHPLLGKRLQECLNAIRRHKGGDPERIFGPIDAIKFRSCLTLFKAVAGQESLFAEVLKEFYQGQDDEITLKFLA